MSLGLVVLEEKLVTQTHTPTSQSGNIKNSMSLGLVVLEEKLFTRAHTPNSKKISPDFNFHSNFEESVYPIKYLTTKFELNGCYSVGVIREKGVETERQNETDYNNPVQH